MRLSAISNFSELTAIDDQDSFLVSHREDGKYTTNKMTYGTLKSELAGGDSSESDIA